MPVTTRKTDLGVSTPPPSGFVSPKVDKGRLTNVRTRYFREFMFNPSEIDTDHGWDWGSHKIPGGSHAVLSGGTGEDRPISLTLYLDADRGRSKNLPGNRDAADKTAGDIMDVSEDIRFYDSFTFPSHAVKSNSLADRGPARAIFTFGPLFPGVEVVVKHVHTKILMFTPDLRPMRAEVTLSLQEYSQRPRLASSVFRDPLDDQGGL